MSITRTAAFGLSLALSAAVLSSCAEHDVAGASDDGMTKIRYLMPFAPNGGEADIYYAQAEGYFRDEGLDVEIMPGKDSQTAVNQVATGGVDIAVVAVKDQMINAAKGQVTVAVGNRHWLGTTGVFTPKDSGLKDLAALEGSNLLHSSASIADLLELTMDKHDLDSSSVEFSTVASSALASTYINGQGDGLLTAVPGYKSLVDAERPSNVILLADYGLTLPGYVFVVAPEYLSDHKDDIQSFLKAAYKATVKARDDLDGAIAAITHANPALDAGTSKAQFKDFTPYICGSEATEQHLPISAMPKDEYQDGLDVMADLGALGDGTVAIEDVLTDSFANTTEETC